MRSVSLAVPWSSSPAEGAAPLVRYVDEFDVATGEPDFDVAGRELVGQVERGLAHRVEQPQTATTSGEPR